MNWPPVLATPNLSDGTDSVELIGNVPNFLVPISALAYKRLSRIMTQDPRLGKPIKNTGSIELDGSAAVKQNTST